MKKLLLPLLLCVAIHSWATDFTVDGLTYTITDPTAKTCRTKAGVTTVESYIEWYEPGNPVEGDIVIPATVVYDGETYSVTEIGKLSFVDCPKLTSVSIPETVTAVNDMAFYYCTALETVSLPSSLVSVGSEAFGDCYKLSSVAIGDLAAWCDIQFKDYWSNPLYNGASLWIDGKEITDLVIPEGVSHIGSFVFAGCKALTALDLGPSVVTIDESAFYDCTALVEVTVSPVLSFSGKSSFSGCSSLEKVTIHDIASWCDITFAANTSNPLNYAEHLFIGDEEVTRLDIPDDITEIKNYAFIRATGIKELNLPATVTSIGEMAFYTSCVASVELPVGLTSMGTWAFAMTDLSEIKIPHTLTEIPNYAFAFCYRLTDVSLPTTLTSIGTAAFSSCQILRSINLPASLKTIGNNSFYNTLISDPVIPSGSIGTSAFDECPLTSVTLGSAVTTVGNYSFDLAGAIENVYVAAIEPPTATDAVFSAYEAALSVPAASKNRYAEAACWSRFTDVRELVEPNEIEITSAPESSPRPGDTFTLGTILRPADTTIPTVVWSSSNPDLATVDTYGNVTVAQTADTEPATCDIVASTLYASGPTATYTLSFNQDGIDNVRFEKPAYPCDVYNLQGIPVLRDATPDDIDKLAPGLYIVGGKKIVIR